MSKAYEQHDISDKSWAKMEPLLLGRKGSWGSNARDNRQFINAVFWILGTGAPWRDLPPSYGDWEIRTVVFAAGATRVSGNAFWNN